MVKKRKKKKKKKGQGTETEGDNGEDYSRKKELRKTWMVTKCYIVSLIGSWIKKRKRKTLRTLLGQSENFDHQLCIWRYCIKVKCLEYSNNIAYVGECIIEKWVLKYLWLKYHDVCNLFSNGTSTTQTHRVRESKWDKTFKMGESRGKAYGWSLYYSFAFSEGLKILKITHSISTQSRISETRWFQ